MLLSSLNILTDNIIITDVYLTSSLRYNFNFAPITVVTTELMDFSYLLNFNYFYLFFMDINEFTFSQTQFNSTVNLNVENMRGIYHYSIPVTKFYYPEPFIASPSFLHYDPWFFHILIYQYWLWFVFIFLIVFFVLTFLSTIRWANPRLRPRRETRGVSRSKCGDLITAMVPVTWAASIIIHESTDAVDLYDGFGTSELAIGIRAFQWGWEYYYPKDIDLNYNLNKNQSFYFGKSLKYDAATITNTAMLKYWRFYQLKATDQVVNPTQFLLTGFNKKSLFNYLNFDNLGCSVLNETNAFVRAYSFSTLLKYDLSTLSNSQYSSNLLPFKANFSSINTQTITTERQTSLLSNKSLFNFANSMSDLKSVIRFANNLIGNYQFNANSNYDFLLKMPGSFDLSNFLTHDFKSKTEISSYNALQSIFFNLSTYNNTLRPLLSTSLNLEYGKKPLNYPVRKFIANTANLALLANYDHCNEVKHINLKIKVRDFAKSLDDEEILKRDAFINNFKNLNLNKPAIANNLTNSNAHLLTNKVIEANVNLVKQYYLSNKDLVIDSSMSNLITNRFFHNELNQPILTTNPFFDSTLYDSTSAPLTQDTPFLMQGDEELIPVEFFATFWDFTHYGTGKNLRNLINLTYNLNLYHTQWPVSALYADYDFRRWQSNELLEDTFWENTIPSFYYYDYLFFQNHFNDYTFLTKSIIFDLQRYLSSDKEVLKATSLKYGIIEKPYLMDLSLNVSYPLILTTDDDIVDYSTLLRHSFFSIYKMSELNLGSDNTYDSWKSYNNYNNNFLVNTFITTLAALKVNTTLEVFDTFRANNDGLFNLIAPQKCRLLTDLVYNFESLQYQIFLNSSVYQHLNFSLLNSQPNLVYSLKNISSTSEAIQKIFRTKLDEMRSHSRLHEYSQTTNNVPFVTAIKPVIQNLGGKNALDFVMTQTFKSTIKWPKNNLFMLANANNTYMFDFPFLLSIKSDAGRYVWTDWNAKWSLRETQASSLAKYGMYGMTQIQKIFDFGTIETLNYRDTEQYVSRLSHVRQNTINSWMFAPFAFLQTYITSNQNLTLTDCSLKTLLQVSSLYWTTANLIETNNFLFFSSQSGSSTSARNHINLYSTIGAYQHYLTLLNDILTKREFMYRQLFEANNHWVNLPLTAIAVPTNPLFQELKTAFTYLDVTTLKAEYGRNEFLHNFNLTFQYTASNLLVNLCKFININYISEFVVSGLVRDNPIVENYYFADHILDESNSLLLKNQHKPIKKGIANMIKLHSTGAIALPIEMRVQLLASSRDVIHSWAVPSAGIKIDCVPGYSSHRVITFLLSGIYWGQCMEVCGRYHHWMPIIVYFMKRDLFLLWCVHFIFLRNNYNDMGVADRFYTDFSQTVSSDYTMWQK